MTSIEFTYPWLLLVAIPLIGLSLIPYFKVGKKYRRTRNRIVSLVLHCLSIVLVTFALAGVSFVHSTSNAANELIILVDVSNTQNEAAENRDNFIDDLLRENAYQGFTVGVVTFGLDQVYAVPLTRDTNSVFDDYLEAELPDTSATDIESALEYARTLFNHPESGKIVLITDGKETDGNIVASASVSAIVAQGTRLDTVYVSSTYAENEYQILDLKTPDVQIKKGVECTLEASVYTNNEGYVRINLYDNGDHVEIGRGNDKTDRDADAKTDNYIVHLTSGTQSVALPYAFKEDGFHELKVSIEPVAEDGASDTMAVNNTYFTYYNIQPHKKVLVFEAFEGESEKLTEVLNDTTALGEGEEYDVSVFNLQNNTLNRYVDGDFEEGSVPRSVDDLRQYDQVILNNIANKDLIENADGTLRVIPLDKLLYSFVYEYGGGMLTVGGKDPSDPTGKTEHAYNRRDMYGTDYQKMLPVEAVNYTPPVGVFIIVDVSGSMGSGDEGDRLYWAKLGATACVGALSERDKIGILTLGNNYDEILPLTPRTEEKKIREGIGSIGPANSGTQFAPSVTYAAEQLRTAQMEKNHIIIVSDCEVGSDDMDKTLNFVRDCYLDARLNLTVSIVNIGGAQESNLARTQALVYATREDGWVIDGEAGCGYYHLADGEDVDSIAYYMASDVRAPLISEINYEPFQPIIRNELSQVVQGIKRGEGGNTVNATLNGYFGVKRRELDGVDLVLTGNFQVPIYARWKYGKGSVGSFMCDLNGGEWSGKFMDDDVGKQLVYNIIDDLMPTTDIRPQEINLTLNGKNYSNHLTCPTELADGESVRGTITAPDGTVISLNQAGEGDGYVVKRPLSESNRYSVCDFQITKGGIYTITIQKVDAEGNVLASASVVKEFSYSKEYDVEYDKTEEEVRALLGIISENGKGAAFDETVDAGQIFREFQTRISTVFDPRLLLIILAISLFLLDVAVRKFKFKWLHEIIREKKQKAQGGQIRKEEQNEENH